MANRPPAPGSFRPAAAAAAVASDGAAVGWSRTPEPAAGAKKRRPLPAPVRPLPRPPVRTDAAVKAGPPSAPPLSSRPPAAAPARPLGGLLFLQAEVEAEMLASVQAEEEEEVKRRATEEAAAKAQAERRKTELAKQKIEAERQKAEADKKKAEEDRQKAEAEEKKVEEDRQRAEAENEQLAAWKRMAEAEAKAAYALQCVNPLPGLAMPASLLNGTLPRATEASAQAAKDLAAALRVAGAQEGAPSKQTGGLPAALALNPIAPDLRAALKGGAPDVLPQNQTAGLSAALLFNQTAPGLTAALQGAGLQRGMSESMVAQMSAMAAGREKTANNLAGSLQEPESQFRTAGQPQAPQFNQKAPSLTAARKGAGLQHGMSESTIARMKEAANDLVGSLQASAPPNQAAVPPAALRFNQTSPGVTAALQGAGLQHGMSESTIAEMSAVAARREVATDLAGSLQGSGSQLQTAGLASALGLSQTAPGLTAALQGAGLQHGMSESTIARMSAMAAGGKEAANDLAGSLQDSGLQHMLARNSVAGIPVGMQLDQAGKDLATDVQARSRQLASQAMGDDVSGTVQGMESPQALAAKSVAGILPALGSHPSAGLLASVLGTDGAKQSVAKDFEVGTAPAFGFAQAAQNLAAALRGAATQTNTAGLPAGLDRTSGGLAAALQAGGAQPTVPPSTAGVPSAVGLNLMAKDLSEALRGAGSQGIDVQTAKMPSSRPEERGPTVTATAAASSSASSAADDPDPTLMRIRAGIAAGDKTAVKEAVLAAQKAAVPIEPHVQAMLRQWLGEDFPVSASMSSEGLAVASVEPQAAASTRLSVEPISSASLASSVDPQVAPMPDQSVQAALRATEEQLRVARAEIARLAAQAKEAEDPALRAMGVSALSPLQDTPSAAASSSEHVASSSGHAEPQTASESASSALPANAAEAQSTESLQQIANDGSFMAKFLAMQQELAAVTPAEPAPARNQDNDDEAPPAKRQRLSPPRAEDVLAVLDEELQMLEAAAVAPAGSAIDAPAGEAAPALPAAPVAETPPAPSKDDLRSEAQTALPAGWGTEPKEETSKQGREAWEYMNKGTWGAGNFFSFDGFK